MANRKNINTLSIIAAYVLVFVILFLFNLLFTDYSDAIQRLYEKSFLYVVVISTIILIAVQAVAALIRKALAPKT